MALLWRERNLLLCAAENERQEGDFYIPDDLHYRLVRSEAIVTEDEGVTWRWSDLVRAGVTGEER